MNRLYQLRSDIVHGRAIAADVDEMLPQAERAFTAILLWFTRALEVMNLEELIRRLDDALVTGASEWVAGFPHSHPHTQNL